MLAFGCWLLVVVVVVNPILGVQGHTTPNAPKHISLWSSWPLTPLSHWSSLLAEAFPSESHRQSFFLRVFLDLRNDPIEDWRSTFRQVAERMQKMQEKKEAFVLNPAIGVGPNFLSSMHLFRHVGIACYLLGTFDLIVPVHKSPRHFTSMHMVSTKSYFLFTSKCFFKNLYFNPTYQ